MQLGAGCLPRTTHPVDRAAISPNRPTAGWTTSSIESAPGGAGTWGFTGFLPDFAAYSSAASVDYNGFIYQIAGRSTNAAYETYVYSRPDTGSDWSAAVWTRTTSLPAPRWEHAAVAVNGYLYVLGGHTEGSDTLSTTVWSAPLTGSGGVGPWVTVGQLPAARWRHEAVVVGNRIYVIGGQGLGAGTDVQPTVWHADVQPAGGLGAWQSDSSLPEPVTDFSAVAIGSDIYVIGGASTTGISDRVYSAHVGSTGSISGWTLSPNRLPEPRRSHSSVADGNRILTIGGATNSDEYPLDSSVIASTTTSRPSDEYMLQAYRPELHYDGLDTFRADSAAEATDNVVLNSNGSLNRTNYLNRTGAKNPLAAAYWPLRWADLSLSYLGTYASQAGDYIDEPNTSSSDYAVDAQRMHGDAAGDYGNKVYARSVGTSDGGRILQYWLYYYFNGKDPVHEGDWEMVQIHLDPFDHPTRATYAQHNVGERCDWAYVQRNADGHPKVYVARGSHASYFSAGDHGSHSDTASDNETILPQAVIFSTPPTWMSWPGKWGATTSGATSPPGPTGQGTKWSAPATWSDSVDGCTETQIQPKARAGRAMSKKRAAVPVPRVAARRIGERVAIRYRFTHARPSGPSAPVRLITSVDPAGKRYAPLALTSRLRGRTGTIRRPLGLGHAPFVVRVVVVTRDGTEGRPIRLPLR